MKTIIRALLLVCCLFVSQLTEISAQTGTSCQAPAPAYINVLATYNGATIVWPQVPQIQAYSLKIRDITSTTGAATILSIPEYFSTSFSGGAGTNVQLLQNHKYSAVVRSVCGEFTESSDSVVVVFELIVIESIVYGASTDCGLTNCDCPLNSTWWNNKLIKKNVTTNRNWLTTPVRQVISMTVADSAVSTNYAKFKIAKDNCDNNIEVLSCESAPYTISIVGGDNYLRVKNGATNIAYVYLESTRYRVKALTQALKVTVKLCDTCTICSYESIVGNPPSDETFGVSIPPNESDNIAVASLNNFSVAPNPVLDRAKIVWQLEDAQPVTLVLADMTGREMMRFFNREVLEAGDYAFDWQATQLPPGLYHLILTTQSGVSSKQVIKL